MNVLKITIKKKFFDMILSGTKLEEYRDVKPYWIRRLKDTSTVAPKAFIEYDAIEFYNGAYFSKDLPWFKIECKGISIGPAVPEWSGNWQGDVFRLHLGEIIDYGNTIKYENPYTQEDVSNRTSDYVCFDCGNLFHKSPGVVTVHTNTCGLCGRSGMVTHIRTFNWLKLQDK